jgi:hypothetical protein
MHKKLEYLNVQAAAVALHTNPRRIWQLIKEGRLSYIPNPLDRRSKLILISEIEEYSQFADSRRSVARNDRSTVVELPPARANLSNDSDSAKHLRPRIGGLVSDPRVQSGDIEAYLAERWSPD